MPHRRLTALGVLGDRPQVCCFASLLEVREADGSLLAIPATVVRVLRLGRGGTKYGTYYMARLFLDAWIEQPDGRTGAPLDRPILLRTAHPNDRAYGQACAASPTPSTPRAGWRRSNTGRR